MEKVDYSKYLDVSESNFEDFFNELLDINELYSYEVSSKDLKALYSCVIENIKKIKE